MEDFDGKQRKEILYIVTIEFTVLLENRMTRSFGMLFTEMYHSMRSRQEPIRITTKQ